MKIITKSISFLFRKENHQSCGDSSKNSITRKLFHCFLSHCNPFWIHLTYYLTISFLGYMTLSLSKPRVKPSSLHELDLFFTSLSASTISSMSTIEMEAFSNFQLIVLTILMALGGEVFTSLLGLQIELKKSKLRKTLMNSETESDSIYDQDKPNGAISSFYLENENKQSLDIDMHNLKLNSVRYLGYVVLGYFLVVQVVGSILVFSYVSVDSSARRVLKSKAIELGTFSVFSTVSSFSNCGFIPTNENMIVFKRNSGLLLLIIPQILLGNTFYPVFLHITIFALEKITKRRECMYLMKSKDELNYDHLLSGFHSSLLALTGIGFISVQVTLFCVMEWNSEAMNGMSPYQRFVASLFQVVNSRHSGESVLDLSLISSAILTLFVIMMYLPPYTTFLPIKDQEKGSRKGDNRRISVLECVTFSNLTYVAIFVVLICISERESMKNDPLNFNVLNVVIEVISAYGNVGFSTGYSCKRRLNQIGDCTDMCFGFAGKWTPTGKNFLIIVMFLGRLKKFNMQGGKVWELVE